MGRPEGLLDMGRRSAYGILDIGYGSHKTQKKHASQAWFFRFHFSLFTFFCGDGGSRTRVQTRNQYAFYTLILAFVFRAIARPKPPTIALSATFHSCSAACKN